MPRKKTSRAISQRLLPRAPEALISGLITVALLLVVGSASAAQSWYLEIPPDGVSESVARRTLALELRDYQLVADPARAGDTIENVHLHVRISRSEQGFVVEVWDRGESAGRRTISAKGHPATVGRRAALAAAELVHQLGVRRTRLSRQFVREAELQQKVEEAEARDAAERKVGASARFDGLWLPEGAWAVGPLVGAELNAHLPLRFRFELGWLTGQLPILEGAPLDGQAPNWSLVDFRMSGFGLFEPREHLGFELGGLIGVSAVHVGGATSVDNIEGQRDTWTGRLGLSLGGTYELDEHVRARLALDGGGMLRRIPLQNGGEEARLGGAFIGLGLGVAIRP